MQGHLRPRQVYYNNDLNYLITMTTMLQPQVSEIL